MDITTEMDDKADTIETDNQVTKALTETANPGADTAATDRPEEDLVIVKPEAEMLNPIKREVMQKDIHHVEITPNQVFQEIKGGRQMVDYKMIKFCRLCKAKFVVPKAEARRYLCDTCEQKNLTQDKE